jgi:pimeloyl-ACP methyl ester carboxylesterase
MMEPTLRFVQTNGIRMRVAEIGEGPLVLFLHGWPELWYSWRHQMPAVASAGYRAVAPDLRGYGQTDAPQDIGSYDITHIADDIVGLIDALGEESAIVVGHDWGAIIAPQCVLLHPERFTALSLLSVPYLGRGEQSLITMLKHSFRDNFFYILYFQEPGVAEEEFDGDPRGILSRMYVSPDTPKHAPELTDAKMSAGGWIPRLGAPKQLPDWLTAADLDYYVDAFTQSGFRGGFNYYRNFHRNWEITPQLSGARISLPTQFIAGAKDLVIRGASADKLRMLMEGSISDLRAVTLFPGAGHWVQQERAKETNEALIAFLSGLEK